MEFMDYITLISCAVIAVLGLVVWGKLGAVSSKLKEIKKKAEDAYSETSKEFVDVQNPMNIRTDTQRTFDINKMEEPRANFNEQVALFTQYVQGIAIFPMMGLLGTIIGLIPGLKILSTTGDLNKLAASLNTALWTTLVGLVAAIILKYVASKLSCKISEVESIFAENDRKFDYMISFNKVTGGTK